jgi:hypothetical protein
MHGRLILRQITFPSDKGVPMIAFKVFKNGQHICTAGVGEFGFLMTIIRWRNLEDGTRDADLDTSGQVTPMHTDVEWRQVGLKVGDEIRVQIVEGVSESEVDAPESRFRCGVDEPNIEME